MQGVTGGRSAEFAVGKSRTVAACGVQMSSKHQAGKNIRCVQNKRKSCQDRAGSSFPSRLTTGGRVT